MQIEQIKINGVQGPIGFLLEKVSLSWKVRDSVSEKAERIRVEVRQKAENGPVVFEKEEREEGAGEVLDSTGTLLPLTLLPRTRYFVEIEVEGDRGDCAVGKSFFETGKMGESFLGKWIAAAKEDRYHPEFEKVFPVREKVRQARLYISGAGLFEADLNGERIGEEYLTPYLNHYETGLQIITFEIKDLAEGKENRLRIRAGKGWYMSVFGLDLKDNNFGDRMAVIAELRIEYQDGTEEVIATDDSWKVRGSLVEDSGIYDGEIYNRLLWEGKDNSWKPVCVLEHPEEDEGTKNLAVSRLRDRLSLPVIAKETVPVQEVIYTPAGETVLDFGQNFAGYPEFFASFEKGTRVKLEFGEILQQGNFYHKNYRDAKSEFIYVSDGTAQTVRPHFTFFGFRYVKVTGWPGEIDPSAFTGRAVFSDLTRTGYIETGNAKINRLYNNTVWGQRSNFIDIPTDCPQRSERLGWTGDIQVFSPTATYHMDTLAFFRKFFRDLRDEQVMIDGAIPDYLPNFGHRPIGGAIWGDVATFVPWNVYRYYGKLDELAESYPMMKDWVDWIDRGDAARGEAGAPDGGRKYIWDYNFTFGDWVALDGATPMSYKGGTDDAYLASLYYFRSAQIVADSAALLGKAEDEKHYRKLSEKIREAVLREYFTPTGRLAIDSQTALFIALKFGVFLDKERLLTQLNTRFQKDLFKIKGGFAGAPQMCTVLAELGMTELAYDFLFNEEFPGWLYEVNLGATTIWERWNSVSPDGTIADNEMNSLNHYAYGSVMEFLYGYGLGIREAAPGYRKAVIAPNPDIRLRSLSGSYDSVAGRYECSWRIEENGELTISVNVPFGCSATLILPRDPEGRTLELKPGSYTYSYVPTTDYRKPYGWDSRLKRLVKDERAMEILSKHEPVVAGMAASGDPERVATSLRELSMAGFLPINQKALAEAVAELEELVVI